MADAEGNASPLPSDGGVDDGGKEVGPSSAGDVMTKDHAAAFKKVMEKRRIIWCDYAAAFQAALECINTKQSQDFCIKYIPKALPMFCGDGDPPSTPYGHAPNSPGSAWDDWCGEFRRKGNHPAEDQTQYFRTTLLCAVKLVLSALDRGCAELMDALDQVLDPTAPIFSYHREPNRASHQLALELHQECVRIWREGDGPRKRLLLLEKCPFRSLVGVVRSIETQHEGADAAEILNRVALRVEKASAKDLSAAGKACIDLINHLKADKEPGGGGGGGLLTMVSSQFKSDPRKQLKKRLKACLRNIALQATKSSVWQQRRDALNYLEQSIKNDKEFKQSQGQALCEWLDEQQVIDDLFGERAHATIVSETVPLLLLLDLTEERLSVILDAAFMHVGSVRAEVHKVILNLIKEMNKNRTRFVLDRVMEVFEAHAQDPSGEKAVKASSSSGSKNNSSSSALLSLQRIGANQLQAAFEFVTAMFDTSKLHGLFTTVDVMMKGKKVATRAMDVLVAALLTPFCEDQDAFQKLVQDSLFHCLQSSWGEVDGKGQGKACKEYVAELCCNIVSNPETSPLAVKGAFAVLIEVIRLFPRTNFAQRGDKTREECIHGLQKQFDVLQACLSNLKTLSAGFDKKFMDSDKVLETELWTRLLQLRYLLENCTEKQYNLTLDARQVKMLWEALGGPTEACLRWLRLAADSGGIFEENVENYLYTEYICRMDTAHLKPHGFNCYQAFFGDVNNSSQFLQAAGRDGQKSGCKINGAAFVGRRVRVLWKDEKMHNGTICTYMPPTPRAPETQKHTVRWDDTGKEDTHDWTDLHDWHLLEDELSVNILPYEVKSIPKPSSLAGLDFLWNVCFQNADDSVARKAQDMLLDLGRYMDANFKEQILEHVFGSRNVKGMLTRGQADERTFLATRRSLELLLTFLRGQLRICENTFSCTQFMLSRSHGHLGKGKPMTILVSFKDESYKNNAKTVKTHSRVALDDVLREAYPQIAQGGSDTNKITVWHNNNRLVRGPHTTLEELNVTHQSELKLESGGVAAVDPAFGSLGDTIAKEPRYYSVLFSLMEQGDSSLQVLAWEVLMALPTSLEEVRRVQGHAGPWTEVVCNQSSIWRSLYVMQILDSFLLPHDTDQASMQEAASFRRSFVQQGGLQSVVGVMSQAAQNLGDLMAGGSKHLFALLRDTGCSVVLRVLKLCLVEDAGSGPAVGVDLKDTAQVWIIVGHVTRLIILLDHAERGATPAESTVVAIVDGLSVIRSLLRSVSGAPSLDSSSLGRFFMTKNQAELASLGINQTSIQEGSKMASDTGILVNKLLLNFPDEAVRQAVADVLTEMAGMSAEWAGSVVSLMTECLTAAHSECTTCKHFFELLSRLLLRTNDAPKDQTGQVHKATMLASTLLLSADDLNLSNEMIFELLALVHNVLQRGVLPTADLVKVSDQLVNKLYKEFLMRVPSHSGNAARRLMNRHSLGVSNHLQVAPLCEVHETRQVAWALLLTCVTKYSRGQQPAVLQAIGGFSAKTRLPVKVSWSRHNSAQKEDWEHKATVERRKLSCVGLKNQGATCYMNAMMQQLFLDDTLRKCILTAPLAPAPPEKSEELWKCQICTLENDWSQRLCMACEQGERPEKVDPVPHGELLRQLQRTFRFMVDSELQSFDPIQLVEACRDLGLHFKVTSQNDSSEFFDKLLERVEREVGGKEHQEVLKSCFRVRVSSQLASVECSHRKPINQGEFEMSFKVGVERMGTLEKAIQDALAGELMTGDSRVDCEICTAASHARGGEGVVKRAMRNSMFLDGESMPSTLCVQLRRFQFQGNNFIKINDRLAFPLVLDLTPFTRPPKVQRDPTGDGGDDADVFGVEEEEPDVVESVYDLTGIVVHSGQFSFGHYYSFAKDPISGTWLKLDDDQVSEFDLADLESECFGGIQTTVNKWTNCVYKTEKTASAYMLFYKLRGASSPATPQAGPMSTPEKSIDGDLERLNISGSSPALGAPGTPGGTSQAEMAAGVDEILDTNEQMIRRSLLFDEGFSGFVLDLVLQIEASGRPVSLEVFQTCAACMYKSVMHSETHPRLTEGTNNWAGTMERLLAIPQCAAWFLENSVMPTEGELPCWLEGGVVTCPVDEVRHVFTRLVTVAVATVAQTPGTAPLLEGFIEALKGLVSSVSHHWRNLGQYGDVLDALASQGSTCLQLMRERDVLALLLHLFLGPKSPGKEMAKLSVMGASNPWPVNGRSEPDFDAVLRTCSMILRGAGKGRLPRLSETMLGMSVRPAALKLCETDPMAGSTIMQGGNTEPLLLEMCVRADGRLLFEIGQTLVSHLDKPSPDTTTRTRQSQCAQFLCRFLERAIEPASPAKEWEASEAELQDICDQVVNYILNQLRSEGQSVDRYHQHQQRNLLGVKRFAQLVVLFGYPDRHPGIHKMLQPHAESVGLISHDMCEMLRGRAPISPQMAAKQPLNDSLVLMEESLACAKLNTLPGEIYVCGGTGELAALNGVYRMEAQSGSGAANQEFSPSPIFKKGEGNSFFAIAKAVSAGTPDGSLGLMEVWEISHVSPPAHPVCILRTRAGPASHERMPPMWGSWEAGGGPGKGGCTLQILAQWNDDLPVFRNRASDFGGHSGGGLEGSMNVDVSNTGGGSRNVRFGGDDDRNSDSASDEAIAGSDQEGDDGLHGHEGGT